jgi:protocatechuate 3,4-dioxygenase beta subunit
MTEERITRRTLLARAGVTAVGGLAATVVVSRIGGREAMAEPAALSGSSCTLSPEVTEGPYWIQNGLWRRDITEGQPGRPLRVKLRVIRASTCAPMARANVEVWHADAYGDYSGYDGGGGSQTTTRYLRGHQRTGSNGWATFDSIYPGWYSGRAPHIHLKVHVGGNTVHTGQLFFPQSVSSFVYGHGVYASRGRNDTTNDTDSIYQQAGGSAAVGDMTKHSDGSYTALLNCIVQE